MKIQYHSCYIEKNDFSYFVKIIISKTNCPFSPIFGHLSLIARQCHCSKKKQKKVQKIVDRWWPQAAARRGRKQDAFFLKKWPGAEDEEEGDEERKMAALGGLRAANGVLSAANVVAPR